jgi:hypothetical protein
VDVVAIKEDSGELIQAKTSSIDGRALGWEAVKDVVTGEAFYKRVHPNLRFSRVALTNQFFNAQAREMAALNAVGLLDQSSLGSMLEQHEVMLLEVEKILYAEWQDH